MVKQLIRGVLISVVMTSSAFALDYQGQLVPPDSGLKVVDGMISAKDGLNYLARDYKKRLLADDKAMSCYKLTPKNLNKPVDLTADRCKKKIAKDTPPKLRPPRELDRVAGRFESCMLVDLLARRKISQKEYYECTHKQ